MTQHVLDQGESRAPEKQLVSRPTPYPAVLLKLLSMRDAVSAIERLIASYLAIDSRRGPLQ
ncbi:hypothetical protein SAMN05660971_02878 [Halomonas cupida]|uniref:Uncharacterized protein n=1 Tax=Halomonas cupida TaxID=44933 RepID=A0A1M7IAG0_9GAMM|nr:hypothetical protein SAMN05660971_02878 [Halomonas cupida]